MTPYGAEILVNAGSDNGLVPNASSHYLNQHWLSIIFWYSLLDNVSLTLYMLDFSEEA